ncbi:DUF5715 family protein [Prevotella copri]|uniref:DUF5715 family protein n=1 Tax=Segatella copri TaxID=165179 RepID=UPI0022306C67|nr:DUF5715 family protein [Segatella copri]MCW4117168.1 DUF5715 family protein [Segatella copri]
MKLKHIILHIVNVVQAMSGKNRFLLGFVVVVCVLALVRLISPGVAEPRTSVADLRVADSLATDSVDQLAMAEEDKEEENKATNEIAETSDDLAQEAAGTDSETDAAADSSNTPSIFFDKNGKEVKHRIFSVPHFGNTFPDQQDVQILAANKHGVNPVQNREEAEHSKGKLVYVGSNPFFYVDKLNNSIPYLVPRASVLLQDIGRAYFDSLQIKGIPLHKIIVTSILRTKDDVAKLRTRNGNATENSCHLYGTTFDVCYNRYKQIQTRQQPRRQVQNDTLKWVLSEVLRDMRDRNRCLVKYEVKQGCFHITVK